MFKRNIYVFLFGLTVLSPAMAESHLQLDVTLPNLDVNPYHKPFVAVWLETPERKYVTTVALWANDMEWYKDLRQWWRKAGRSAQPFDAVTGATKKPGKHKLTWNGLDGFGKSVLPGEYILKIEASREEGGREYLKTPISLNQHGELILNGKAELGAVVVHPGQK